MPGHQCGCEGEGTKSDGASNSKNSTSQSPGKFSRYCFVSIRFKSKLSFLIWSCPMCVANDIAFLRPYVPVVRSHATWDNHNWTLFVFTFSFNSYLVDFLSNKLRKLEIVQMQLVESCTSPWSPHTFKVNLRECCIIKKRIFQKEPLNQSCSWLSLAIFWQV